MIACSDRATLPNALTAETVEGALGPVGRLDELPLHPGFATSWGQVLTAARASTGGREC